MRNIAHGLSLLALTSALAAATGCASDEGYTYDAPPPGEVPNRAVGLGTSSATETPTVDLRGSSSGASQDTPTSSTAGTRQVAPPGAGTATRPTTAGGRLLSPPTGRPAAPRQDVVPLVGPEGRGTVNTPAAGDRRVLTPSEIGDGAADLEADLQQPSTGQ